MKTKHWLGVALIIVGGIGLAYIVAMAFNLYLPNIEAKAVMCLLMFGVGVFLVWNSRVLASGVLQGIFRRGKQGKQFLPTRQDSNQHQQL
jgi:hypothetical protein